MVRADLRREARVHRRGHRSGAGPRPSASPTCNLRFAFLRFGSCVLELLRYDNERQETFDRSNADVGSAHVCIEVPDLQKAYDDLQAKGIEFLAPPLHIDDGPLAGGAFVYFKDPNGVTLEVSQGFDGHS